MRQTTVSFDLETGGLQPHHPDIQLAAVAVDSDWKEIGVFEEKIHFDVAGCDSDALSLNSYNQETWATYAQPESEVVRLFGRWLESYRTIEKTSKKGRPYMLAALAGHNVSRFDCDRLAAMFKRHGKFLPTACYEALDTLQLARWCFRGRRDGPENMKQSTLADYFGIEVVEAHDALSDVRTNIAVARRLLCGSMSIEDGT